MSKLTTEALYLQLGGLIAEMPDLENIGAVSNETNRWLGLASALLEVAGVGTDSIEFKVAVQGLGTVLAERNAQTIKSLLYSALGRLELAAPASVQGSFIPAGGHFEAFAAFGKVFGTAMADILIVDPYANEKALTDFAVQAPGGVAVRLLTGHASDKASLQPAAERWMKQYAEVRPLEVRIAQPKSLHDRLLFVDRKTVWTFGQSLNAIAERAHTSIVRVDTEIAVMKVAAFEAIWAEAVPL